jgi:alkanesulfonate monooxygenase SsuD/methylene tetrahydromethanopterin reductase-like flavin-dependent oxidoreductase (luciferase family)
VHSFFVSESGNSIDTYSKHVYYFAKDNEKAVRSYQGDIFQLPEGTLSVPSPVQGDSPPVFVAALSPETTDWAASNHYPIMSDQFAPLASPGKITVASATKTRSLPSNAWRMK